ncbi:hypothetical protein NX059_010849 [Plenodomus lindquistii]|nr:hypothetical protein NX059_010849 [Plenodomus lindquistii]
MSDSATALSRTPKGMLEQRIFDLLLPYRDELFSTEFKYQSTDMDRKAVILSQSLAFLIRNRETSNSVKLEAENVSIAARKWDYMRKGHQVAASVGIFLNTTTYVTASQKSASHRV